MLRGWLIVGCDVLRILSARVRSLPWEDAPKMVALLWCSKWSPSTRRMTCTEAQATIGVRCCVPDALVKEMMLVSLGTGRRAIAVGG